MYAYGVSMGASMLTLYLVNESENCPLKGAMPYGLPYNLKDNVPFFKKNAFRFYDFIMGFNFFMIMKSKLSEIKAFMTED